MFEVVERKFNKSIVDNNEVSSLPQAAYRIITTHNGFKYYHKHVSLDKAKMDTQATKMNLKVPLNWEPSQEHWIKMV